MFLALISELDWDEDSEVALDSFREGLPRPMVRNVLMNEGLPQTMKSWIQTAQEHHARYALGKAIGVIDRKNQGANKKKGDYFGKNTRKPRDPDAMDVDRITLHPKERERLMASGSCFYCKEAGHRIAECPKKNQSPKAQEATVTKEKPT